MRHIILCAWVFVAWMPFTASAKVVGLFDMDSTLFEDRGLYAAWITPWILKRVEQLHSTFQQLPNRGIEVELTTPEQIAYYNEEYKTMLPTDTPVRVTLNLPDQITVSTNEYNRLEWELARGEKILGGLKPVLLDFDPVFPDRELLIIPGYYRIFDQTFKYYRESTGSRQKNYLLLNLEAAKERAKILNTSTKDGSYRWQGPAFPLFQTMMSSPETVSNVIRFTSRGHRLKDYWAFDDQLVKEGLIKFSKAAGGERPLVHSLSQPEARVYGNSLVEKKVDVVRNTILALYYSAGKKHSELDKYGKMRAVHTLIVAEDDPAYVDAIANLMLAMSGNLFADRVKLVLFNTGLEEEVRNSANPQRWTVFFQGRHVRPALPEEIEFWHKPSCEALLAGGK